MDTNYRAPSYGGANQGLLEEFDIWCTIFLYMILEVTKVARTHRTIYK